MNPAANALVPLAFAAIVPLGLLCDAVLPRHRAVLTTLLAGLLFLPSAQIDVAGVLFWNRATAPVVVVMLGVLMRDWGLLTRFRPRWWDLPMLAWCLAPGLASLSNGFRLYDAFAAIFYQTLWLGGPYFIGRLHFRTREQLRDLAAGIVIGCLIYAPLCWFEIRMSPTLHETVYGFVQHEFGQTVRGSYYRPMVFMEHGLMAAMWMAMGALVAGALALASPGRRLFQLPLSWLAVGLTLTFIAMQSLGALVLLALAWLIFAWCRRTGWQWPLLALAVAPLLWCGLRASGALPSQAIVSAAALVSAERADSLAFRLETEDALAGHVMERPLFGWSTWDRDRIVEVDYEERKLVLDGLWILNLSQNGFFGLGALLAAYLLPLLIVFRRVRAASWRADADAQALGCLAVVLAITMVDNLFNAMVNPVFILLMGALPTVAEGWRAPLAGAPPARPDANPADGSPPPRVLGA